MLSKGRRDSDKLAFAPKFQLTFDFYFGIFNCSFEIDHHNDREFLGPITNKLVNNLRLFVLFGHQMQAVIK